MGVLDYVMFSGMIAITVLVGVYSSKRVKDADEYIMAGRSLNKLQSALSMAATDFGGSGLVAAVGYSYLSGLGGMWWNLAAVPAFLFVGFFLAKKLNRLQSHSVPDYLGQRYSPACKLLGGTMHFFTNIALLSTQFTIASATFSAITGMSPTSTLICTVSLVLALTLMGGLRAVVNTDVTLFIFIVASVISCLFLTLNKAGGLTVVYENVPDGFTSIGSIGVAQPLSWVLMCVFTYSTNQNYVQRILSAKDEKTARFSAFFTAGFYVLISIALGLIGITARVLMPNLTDMNSVFPSLLMEYFPAGLLGLAIAGVFAATISTGSSILHSATTLFAGDIYKYLSPEKKEAGLMGSRIITLCISVTALILSLVAKNIIDVIYIASLFYSTSVFFPLLLGINNKRVTASGAMSSMIGAVVSGLVWERLAPGMSGILSSVPSNLVSVGVGLVLLLAVSRCGFMPGSRQKNIEL